MLTLTDNASAVVNTLVGRRTDADEAGLRIRAAQADASEGEARLALDIADAPEPDDQIVEHAGARVFVETGAIRILDDKVLDADVDDSGAVSFAVLPQAA